jgi:hypothetical protein
VSLKYEGDVAEFGSFAVNPEKVFAGYFTLSCFVSSLSKEKDLVIFCSMKLLRDASAER